MHQSNLFGSTKQRLDLPDADLVFWPEFVDSTIAATWFDELLKTTPWQQHELKIFGKKYLAPRLSQWVGEPWMSYEYSHHLMTPEPWTPFLSDINSRIGKQCGAEFNSVLINYYRDGNDSNGWHSDDEPELGEEPVIASLSLGAVRDFHLRHKQTRQVHKMALTPGSLLMMQGKTQACWQHQIPKRAHAEPRINLTFRRIVKQRG